MYIAAEAWNHEVTSVSLSFFVPYDIHLFDQTINWETL